MIEDFNDIPEINEREAKLAGEVVSFALINDIKIDSVEPDVLGGVAIYLSNETSYGFKLKTAWVSILNSGTRAIIIRRDNMITSSKNNIDYDFIMENLFDEPSDDAVQAVDNWC